MQQKRDNPDFQKAPDDDLVNMRTGIFGWKGEIHYKAAPCLNDWLATLNSDTPNNDIFLLLRDKINVEIHKNYKLYPSNYIAADMLDGEAVWAKHGKYRQDERAAFEQYLGERIALVDLPNPDTDYLRQQILLMYANPLYNYCNAVES